MKRRHDPDEVAERLAREAGLKSADAANTKKSRDGQAPIMFWGDPAVRRQLKMLSVESGKTQQRLLAEALNLLFREYHKPEIALA